MKPSEAQDIAFGLIREERERQDAIWGSQRHLLPDTWLAILTEEVGESAKAVLEIRFPIPNDSRAEERLQQELVEVAAVAVAWIEALVYRRLP